MSNGVDFKKMAVDLRQQLTGMTTERDAERLRADTAVAEVAALREELKAMGERYQKDLVLSRERWCYGNRADAKLAAAAQRNAELVELLRSMSPWLEQIMARSQYDLEFMPAFRAALKPTESGASE